VYERRLLFYTAPIYIITFAATRGVSLDLATWLRVRSATYSISIWREYFLWRYQQVSVTCESCVQLTTQKQQVIILREDARRIDTLFNLLPEVTAAKMLH